MERVKEQQPQRGKEKGKVSHERERGLRGTTWSKLTVLRSAGKERPLYKLKARLKEVPHAQNERRRGTVISALSRRPYEEKEETGQ